MRFAEAKRGAHRVFIGLSAMAIVAVQGIAAPAAADDAELLLEIAAPDPVTAGDPVDIEFTATNISEDEDAEVASVDLSCSAEPCGSLEARLSSDPIGPGDTAAGSISGNTPEREQTLEITVSAHYYLGEDRDDDPQEASASTVLELEPQSQEPPPTDPAPTPTPTPTPTPEPASPPDDDSSPPGVEGSASPPPSSQNPPAGQAEESGSSSSGSGGGSGAGSQAPRSSAPGSDPAPGAPRGGNSDPLPTDPLDLPSLESPDDDALNLPFVSPGGEEEEGEDSAALTNDPAPLRAPLAPSVLLLTLLLLLLLAAPLAPARRVRAGAPYRGRRRRW